MAGETLQGMKVAILVTDGFELIEPRKALDQAGADTHVVSPKGTKCAVGISPIGANLCQSI